MSDKVRYYLEQSVPELEDLQKKGLFDKKEITMIMRRRTDFEHRIQGRGSKPKDFLRYATFEMNLEKLRRKRYNRLSKVSGLINTKPLISDWAGVRRILFILDRGTRRYPAEVELWAQYLKFAKSNGAIKIIYKVYSRLLQLQPRNVDAWLSAAKYEFETNANAKGARSLFQRAIRLNPDSFELWFSYTQFELTYVARLLARRKVLGLITEKQQMENMKNDESQLQKLLEKTNVDDNDFNLDTIELPSGEDMKEELHQLPEADMNMLGNPETNPALRGDVALTVFDLSIPELIKNLPQSVNISDRVFQICHRFLNLIDMYDDLNRDYLYSHVLQYLQTQYPDDFRTLLIDITLPIRTTSVKSSDLSNLLQLSVNKFRAYKLKLNIDKEQLTKLFINYLQTQYLSNIQDEEGQDEAPIVELIRAIIKKLPTI